MRSRTEKLSSKRSIINHDHLITDEACMIGIYREGVIYQFMLNHLKELNISL